MNVISVQVKNSYSVFFLATCFTIFFIVEEEILQEHLIDIFDSNNIDEITYQAWLKVDRTDLVTKTLSVNDFVSEYIYMLKVLKNHDFIYRMQDIAIKQTKEQIKVGEFLAVLDFSENFKHIVQDSAQAHYFG